MGCRARLEPGERAYLSEEEFDTACQAIADFTDLKSPYTLGHSRGVAALAAGAARRCGLPGGDVAAIRRAGCCTTSGGSASRRASGTSRGR